MHLRSVPTNPDCLGNAALTTEPAIKQVFITGVTDDKVDIFERTLYIIRKKIEKRVAELIAQHPEQQALHDFYICSLSSRSIVYKGMLSSLQLRLYFPDLTNSYFTSGLALVHSRFSTNTFPTWSLAQPFRLLCHNGEINTIRGNRGWMQARESVLSSDTLGDIRDISPIVQPALRSSEMGFLSLKLSGTITAMAWGSERPLMTKNSNTLSSDAESLMPGCTIGEMSRMSPRVSLDKIGRASCRERV